MNNRQHCQATRLLLGIDPHPGLHAFMDEYSQILGRGHRLLRHNLETIEFAGSVYDKAGELEAVFHIASDMGMVTVEDIQWGKHIETAKRKTKRTKS